ncbi:MAG TPA: glycogen synthase GlgA [Geobacteraceae bacterium]|nr:glycogen synthase GlgA [Geobacteraceae bacterium]
MKILFIASEVAPFAKTGGLADVTGSLPLELKRLGHDVRIIIPFYKTVAKGDFLIRKIRKSIEVPLGGSLHKGLLRHTLLADIPVYLLENKEFFSRDQLYGTSAADYPDNPLRFAFFCRGVLDLLKRMDYRPDVLHCHDWQTALVPITMKYEHAGDPFYGQTAVIFTIHNLAYQGLFPVGALDSMGLNKSCFTIDRLEFYGKVNLMKGGILTADLVNTVSESYCEEILGEEEGCGLEGVLATRRDALSGILNGIDYAHWDPATDRELFRNYSASAPAGKAANKKGLQKLLGLEQNEKIPLIGMVTRMIAQKGFDLMEPLLHRFASGKLQLVVVGTGEARYTEMLREIRAAGAGNIVLHEGFDTNLARKVYGGSDIFLMPSHFEPCGLGQMIALRYGTVPVVRRTGGLRDTVVDEVDNGREQNGFSFDDYGPEALWEALMRTVRAFNDKEKWKKIVRRGMNCDYSWKRSAVKYEELYRRALARKGVEEWIRKKTSSTS